MFRQVSFASISRSFWCSEFDVLSFSLTVWRFISFIKLSCGYEVSTAPRRRALLCGGTFGSLLVSSMMSWGHPNASAASEMDWKQNFTVFSLSMGSYGAKMGCTCWLSEGFIIWSSLFGICSWVLSVWGAAMGEVGTV